MLNITEGEPEKPLGIWISVCAVLDILTFVSLVAKIPYIRKA